MESCAELNKKQEALKYQIFELYRKQEKIKKDIQKYCPHENKISFQPSYEYCVYEADYCKDCGIIIYK